MKTIKRILPIIIIIVIAGISQKAFSQVNAGLDQEICTDSTMLNADNPAPAVGFWTIISGSASIDNDSLYNTIIRNISLGTIVLRWNVDSLYDDVVITNNSVIADAGVDQEVYTNSTTLSANDSLQTGVGVWTTPSPQAIIENPNNNVTVVTNLAIGSNTFIWTFTNGNCQSSDQVTINYIDSTTTSVYAGLDQEICSDSTMLNADNPYPATGFWTVLAGTATFGNDSVYNTYVINLSLGQNVLRWTVDGVYDDVVITNNSVIANAGLNDTTTNSSYQMNADTSTIGTGYWTVVAGTATPADPNDPNTFVSNLALGSNIFRWTVLYNGCVNSDDVEIVFAATAGEDIIVEGDTVQLNAYLPEGGIGEWTVMKGAAHFENDSLPNTRAWDLGEGENILRWTVYMPYKGYTIWDDVTVTKTTLTNIESFSSDAKIYPNPTKGIINIVTNQDIDIRNIQIFNIIGSQINFKVLQKSSENIMIDISQNNKGIYFLRIKSKKSLITKKIIVE